MPDLSTMIERLGTHAAFIAPRILTQVCRDPNSAAYGSFDRDWWHYRIRDFSSVILQQGAYAIWLAGRLDALADGRDDLARLAAAGCRFWNARAIRRGAFEEYYPWECGYAPMAFSTLAVMKLAAAGVISAGEVRAGARVAARQLTRRFEAEAANQQVAGLAALAWIGKVFPELADPKAFAVLTQRTLALQTAEGWFIEYGGPDLAYLSVALDCLWDLHDATAEACFVQAAERALAYMAPYALLFGASIGMHNSRNTDYILPYGLSRFAVQGAGPSANLAAAVLVRLYESLPSPEHFTHAIDDRYHCHYSGHSLIRAYLCLSGQSSPKNERGFPQADAARPAALFDKPDNPVEFLLPECGHYLKRGSGDDLSLLLSLRKGGVLTAVHGRRRVSDYGWHVGIGTRQFVNHWWSDQWTWQRAETQRFVVRGRLVPHRETLSTPFKHLVLRTLSFFLGAMIIPALKRLLIFKRRSSPYTFERVVTIASRRIVVRDRMDNLPPDAVVFPAPRASKRHVSSADSYHREDLRLAEGVECRRTTNLAQGVFTAETSYDFT